MLVIAPPITRTQVSLPGEESGPRAPEDSGMSPRYDGMERKMLLSFTEMNSVYSK